VKVSVIIISYNQIDLLKNAIESVIGQTVIPDQIVIADDASSDGSQDLIRDYSARFPGLIRPLLSPKNQGVSKNRNAGILAATGDLITWLDGDDVFLPKKIESEKHILETCPEVDWVYSQVKIVNVATGQSVLRYTDSFEVNSFIDISGIMGREPRNPMVRAAAFQIVGLFDVHLNLYEDFDFMLRLSHFKKGEYINQENMEYRVSGGGLHNAGGKEYKRNFKIVKRNFLKLVKTDPVALRRKATRVFLCRGDLTLARSARRARRYSLAFIYGSIYLFRYMLCKLFITRDHHTSLTREDG